MREKAIVGKIATIANREFGRIRDQQEFINRLSNLSFKSFIAKEVQLHVNGCLSITCKDELNKTREILVTKLGLRSLCSYLGIPHRYVKKINTSLALLNINELKKDKLEKDLLQIFYIQEDNTDYAVSFMPSNYKPVKLSSIVELLQKSSSLKFKEARVSEYAVDVDIIVDDALRDSQEDEYSYGVSITVSEPGFYPSFMVRPYFMRMICTNGVVVPLRMGGFKRGHFSPDTAVNILEGYVRDTRRFARMLEIGLDRPLKKGELFEGAALVKQINRDLLPQLCGISYEDYVKLSKDMQDYKQSEEVEKPTRKELFVNLSEFGRDIKEVELSRKFRVFAGKLIKV